MHETIQYLEDRKLHEDEWLEALHRSPVNCSLIWGLKDPVAVPAVADYVWQKYLKNRPAAATYTQIPGANHYIQVDHAQEVSKLVLAALQLAAPTVAPQ
jgi:pimeloyl-ACP methyl ester carboxylesterase